MIYTCPKCHNTDLHCHVVVRATLRSIKEQSGAVQLTMLAWDEVLDVESYECLNCGNIFSDEY